MNKDIVKVEIVKLIDKWGKDSHYGSFAWIFTGEALIRVPMYCTCSQAHDVADLAEEELDIKVEKFKE